MGPNLEELWPLEGVKLFAQEIKRLLQKKTSAQRANLARFAGPNLPNLPNLLPESVSQDSC